jgi:diacylglycerol kinase family enzyme
MRVLVISNPESGGRNKDNFMQRLKSDFNRYGLAWDIFETTGKKDEEKLKIALAEIEPHSVLVVGGDGTLNLAARALIHQPVTIGLIPFGSANGMSEDLGIDSDVNKALDDFLKSKYIVESDLLKINNDHFCIHIGDVGLNAQIVEEYTRSNDRGMAGYAKHFIRTLTQSDLINFNILADEKEYREEGYMLAFANARRYGSGIILNDKGNISDGKFELVLVKSVELRTLLLAGLSRFNNQIPAENMGIEVISCKKATIRLDHELMVQVDGELIGKQEELNIEIIPRAVRIIAINPESD